MLQAGSVKAKAKLGAALKTLNKKGKTPTAFLIRSIWRATEECNSAVMSVWFIKQSPI